MAFEHDESADHTITLADGRTLGYAEFGDPDGYPILNNHGGLVCRLDVELAADEAKELGVRIISPDRPGVATSSRKADRDTLDWADDMAELLDALGLDEFANMGWSMGGQYALAVAHRFADRVSGTVVIAGGLPLDDEATFAELNEMDQKLTNLSNNHPAAARTEFAALRALEGLFPERMAKMSMRNGAPADREAITAHADWFAACTKAALTDGHGMVDEYVAWAKPWRFALADVPGAVAVWQGTDDSLVPREWGERMADELPNGVLHLVEGEGHLIAVTHRPAMIEDLLAAAGT